jgi:hypothetical protein
MKKIFITLIFIFLFVGNSFAEFHFTKIRQLSNGNIELTYQYGGTEKSIDMSKAQWKEFLKEPNDEFTILRVALKSYLKNDPDMTTIQNLLDKTLTAEATVR